MDYLFREDVCSLSNAGERIEGAKSDMQGCLRSIVCRQGGCIYKAVNHGAVSIRAVKNVDFKGFAGDTLLDKKHRKAIEKCNAGYIYSRFQRFLFRFVLESSRKNGAESG